VQAWKLEVQASVIFSEFFNNKGAVLKLANSLFEENRAVIGRESSQKRELAELKKEIEGIKTKIDKLLELRLAEEIDKEDYSRKREELNTLNSQAEKRIAEILNCQDKKDDIEARVRAMKEVIDGENNYDFTRIPEGLIDAFVEKIVVHEDYLEWHLKFDGTTSLNLSCVGQKRNAHVIMKNGTTPISMQQHRLLSLTRSDMS
jgi:hypothetical protein